MSYPPNDPAQPYDPNAATQTYDPNAVTQPYDPNAVTQPYEQLPPAPGYLGQAQPDGYPQPPLPVPPAAPQRPAGSTTLANTNTFALVAIITAFLSPIAAVVFGHLALNQIKRTGDAGRGIALTGLIIGYCYFALIALAIITYISIIGLILASMGAFVDGMSDFSSY